MSKKPTSKAEVETSSEDSNEEVKQKPKKKQKKAKESSTKQDDGSFIFPIANKRQVSVRQYKGKIYIDIREFYESDGEMKPGRKGISLQIDQWEKLKDLSGDIDEAVKTLQGD